MTGRAKPGTRAPFFGSGRFRIAGHHHSVSRRTRAADEDVEVNEPHSRAGSNHSRRARGHGAMFQPHDRGQGGRAQFGACVPRLPLGIQRARLVPPRRRPRRASVLVIEPDRPRTRDGPARVAASSRPVGSRLDRAGRIDGDDAPRRRARVAPSVTSRDARSRADRRAFAAANGSGRKLANRDSARDSRSPETKPPPTIAASARQVFKKKSFRRTRRRTTRRAIDD